MAPTVTHNVIIADRSETGSIAVASILESCPLADGQVSAWRKSASGFLIFVAEHDSGRFGAISAETLDQLITTTLPSLFAKHLLPHTRSEFHVFVDEVIGATVQDGVARSQIAAALDAGRPNDGSESTPKVARHIQPPQDTPPGLTRSERERSIRFLCQIWDESRGSGSTPQVKFSSFEGWLKANGYSHYLVAARTDGPDVDAEAWFNDETSRIVRVHR